MTTARRLEILGALLAVAIFFVCWQREREARIRAEVQTQADEKLVQAKDAAIHDRDALDAQYAAALSHQSDAVKTPQQAAQVILRYLPAPAGQAAPASIPEVPRAALSPEVQKTLPDAPSFSLLTPAQIQQVARDELACDATRHSLTTCQQDAVDLKAQVALKTDEAHTWETAAKGGTKLQRFGRVLKGVACAGAGATLGALASQKNPITGAAIGAGAGVAGCSLF